ncbi:hypothetical protein KFE25_011981 [Diacronema lutheri]|uniref:Uncharacterized protein n=1 Tax=Diacronema lutheri TaxID=2081491 RepID=A0A8J5XC12_DIALT|nr:hypothetical protein KFE25_011981 [Diacronema lutheri]
MPAVVSCLRCSEPNLLGGLPRCGCFVHALLVAPSASAVAILDGAPRRPRRARISSAARERRRGVLARDAVTRYNSPPRWFAPSEPAPTSAGELAAPLAVPVYADAGMCESRAGRAPPAAAGVGGAIVRAGRSFARAAVLSLESRATLRDVQSQLRALHGIRCTALGRARVPPAGGGGGDGASAERGPVAAAGLDGLLVELTGTQLGCTAWPFFAQPGDVLCVW